MRRWERMEVATQNNICRYLMKEWLLALPGAAPMGTPSIPNVDDPDHERLRRSASPLVSNIKADSDSYLHVPINGKVVFQIDSMRRKFRKLQK